MKVGDLVKYKGEIGIVLEPCFKTWAKEDDVWVLWHHSRKPKVESLKLLEVVSESR